MIKNRLVFTFAFLLIITVSYFVNTESHTRILRKLSEFTFWIGFSVFILSVLTTFVKDSTYDSWRKFTKYFLVFAVVAILITPTSGSSGGSLGMDIYAIDKELVTILLSGLYAVISLPLIIYKTFKKD